MSSFGAHLHLSDMQNHAQSNNNMQSEPSLHPQHPLAMAHSASSDGNPSSAARINAPMSGPSAVSQPMLSLIDQLDMYAYPAHFPPAASMPSSFPMSPAAQHALVMGSSSSSPVGGPSSAGSSVPFPTASSVTQPMLSLMDQFEIYSYPNHFQPGSIPTPFQMQPPPQQQPTSSGVVPSSSGVNAPLSAPKSVAPPMLSLMDQFNMYNTYPAHFPPPMASGFPMQHAHLSTIPQPPDFPQQSLVGPPSIYPHNAGQVNMNGANGTSSRSMSPSMPSIFDAAAAALVSLNNNVQQPAMPSAHQISQLKPQRQHRQFANRTVAISTARFNPSEQPKPQLPLQQKHVVTQQHTPTHIAASQRTLPVVLQHVPTNRYRCSHAIHASTLARGGSIIPSARKSSELPAVIRHHPFHLTYCRFFDGMLASSVADAFERIVLHGRAALRDSTSDPSARRFGVGVDSSALSTKRNSGKGMRGATRGLEGREMFVECYCLPDENFQVEEVKQKNIKAKETSAVLRDLEERNLSDKDLGRRNGESMPAHEMVMDSLRHARWIICIVTEDALQCAIERDSKNLPNKYLDEIEEALALAGARKCGILPIFVGRPNGDGTRRRFEYEVFEEAENLSPRVLKCINGLTHCNVDVRLALSVENIALEILRTVDPVALGEINNFPARLMRSYLINTPPVFTKEIEVVHRSILAFGSCIISGPSGVGKTLLAVQYAHKHRAMYSHHLFINMRSRHEAADCFSAVYAEVCAGGHTRATLAESRLPVLGWLERACSTYLLIIDGVRDCDTLGDIFEELRGFAGNVIVTTESMSSVSRLYLRPTSEITETKDGPIKTPTQQAAQMRLNIRCELRLHEWSRARTRKFLGVVGDEYDPLPVGSEDRAAVMSIDSLAKRARGVLPCHLASCYVLAEGVGIATVVERITKVEDFMSENATVEGVERGMPSFLNVIFHLTMCGLVTPTAQSYDVSRVPPPTILGTSLEARSIAGKAAAAVLDVLGFLCIDRSVPLQPFCVAAVEEFCLPFGGPEAAAGAVGRWILETAIAMLEIRGLIFRVESHLGPAIMCHPTVRKLVRARDLSIPWGQAGSPVIDSKQGSLLSPLERVGMTLLRGYEAVNMDSSSALTALHSYKSGAAYRISLLDHITSGFSNLAGCLEEYQTTSGDHSLFADRDIADRLETTFTTLALRISATPSLPQSLADVTLDSLLRFQTVIRDGSTANTAIADTLDLIARRFTKGSSGKGSKGLNRARTLHEQALLSLSEALGTRDHIDVARSLATLSSLARDEGDLASARGYANATLRIFARWHGSFSHIDVINSLGVVAGLATEDGDMEEARDAVLTADRALSDCDVNSEELELLRGRVEAIKAFIEGEGGEEDYEAVASVAAQLAQRRITRREVDVTPIVTVGVSESQEILSAESATADGDRVFPTNGAGLKGIMRTRSKGKVEDDRDYIRSLTTGNKRKLEDLGGRSIKGRGGLLTPREKSPLLSRKRIREDDAAELEENGENDRNEHSWDHQAKKSKVSAAALETPQSAPATAASSPKRDNIGDALKPKKQEKKKKRVKPRANIPKPRNSFILYRLDRQNAVVNNARPGRFTEGVGGDVSKIMATMWANEKDDVRAMYRMRAKEEQIAYDNACRGVNTSQYVSDRRPSGSGRTVKGHRKRKSAEEYGDEEAEVQRAEDEDDEGSMRSIEEVEDSEQAIPPSAEDKDIVADDEATVSEDKDGSAVVSGDVSTGATGGARHMNELDMLLEAAAAYADDSENLAIDDHAAAALLTLGSGAA